MAHWHYQVMKHPDGTYAIHEYFEMPDGDAWTERPVTVDGETVEDVIEALRLMVIDIGRHGVKEYPNDATD